MARKNVTEIATVGQMYKKNSHAAGQAYQLITLLSLASNKAITVTENIEIIQENMIVMMQIIICLIYFWISLRL